MSGKSANLRIKYFSSGLPNDEGLLRFFVLILLIGLFSYGGWAKDRKQKTVQPKKAKSDVCHQPTISNQATQNLEFQNQSIPDVQVVDQNGQPRAFYRDLIHNKNVAINFIYTTCESLCPIQAKTFANLQKALDKNQAIDLQLISISIDPQKDSPERLKIWGQQFGAKAGWTFVTGEKSEIDKLLEVMTGDPSGKREHSSIMLIGNAQTNRWRRTFSFAPPERIFEILGELNNRTDKAESVQQDLR